MPDTAAPSAPAAPVSAPAPTPAPAPEVSSPSPAPAAPAPTVENSSSIAEAWQRAQAEVPVGVDDAEVEAPAPEPEAAAPEAATEDQPAPAEGETTEAAPDAEADPDLALPELTLEDGDFGPKELGDFLKKDAAVDKFFNDHPEVKNRIFGMARRDSETRAIREIAPTVEIAQEMQRGHQLYNEIDNSFLTATTPEGFKGFMDKWVQQSLIVDDKGQPIKGEDGKYKIHPALTSVIENIHANRNTYLLGEMAKDGKIPPAIADSTLKVIDFLSKSTDERVQEAAQVLKEALSPSSSAQGELPDELKSHSEALDARKRELDEREAAQARTQRESEQTARVEALRRADSKAAESCLTQVNAVLKKAGLTDYEQKAARGKIGDLIDQKLRANPTYQAARDRLEEGPMDAAREKAISKLVLTYTQEILGPIVRDTIREATQGKVARQADTDRRVAEQQSASRTDARGGSVTSSPGGPMTTAQIEAGIIKEYQDSHNGEIPPRSFITTQMWQRMNAGPGRRTA